MNAVVSIITPTYNRGHLLSRAWSSLLKQTEQRFQWIIVDDGSNDSTRDVVRGFNDCRITYVWQENHGVNWARNRGEKEVSAEFVIFLDSDDELLDETTLQQMLEEILSTRPDIACVSFTVVDSQMRSSFYHLPGERLEANYRDHICEQTFRGEFFPIYRRDALSISPWPPFNAMEVLRHWRIARQRPVVMINRPARIYHRGEVNSLTSAQSVINRATDVVLASEKLIEEHKKDWLTYCPCQLGKYNFYKAMHLTISDSACKALPSIGRAARYGKFNIKLKALLIFIFLALPLPLRKYIFINYAKVKSKFFF